MVERSAVNPWAWSMAFGFNQGELVAGAERVLFLSGQTPVDADGAPQHAGDMAAQIALAADNVEAVLSDAGMTLANLVRLNVYTTDVDAFVSSWDVLFDRTRAAGVAPAGVLLGVARLAFPDQLVELEATAVA
jgi:enamine deaminase RidA (YjgF/YER057c/UK114 family)